MKYTTYFGTADGDNATVKTGLSVTSDVNMTEDGGLAVTVDSLSMMKMLFPEAKENNLRHFLMVNDALCFVDIDRMTSLTLTISKMYDECAITKDVVEKLNYLNGEYKTSVMSYYTFDIMKQSDKKDVE